MINTLEEYAASIFKAEELAAREKEGTDTGNSGKQLTDIANETKQMLKKMFQAKRHVFVCVYLSTLWIAKLYSVEGTM